jgi:hypothetical protein
MNELIMEIRPVHMDGWVLSSRGTAVAQGRHRVAQAKARSAIDLPACRQDSRRHGGQLKYLRPQFLSSLSGLVPGSVGTSTQDPVAPGRIEQWTQDQTLWRRR